MKESHHSTTTGTETRTTKRSLTIVTGRNSATKELRQAGETGTGQLINQGDSIMDFLIALAGWFLISVPFALLAARFIRFGEEE